MSRLVITARLAGIVVIAIVCHYIGIPNRTILLVAGLMLSYLLLEAFWIKNSVARARVLMVASTLGGLFLMWYLFKAPLFMLIPGGIFLFVIMFVNAVWMKKSLAKSKDRIAQWAAANGWQLLKFEHRFDTGPFGGFHGRGDMYFEFVIYDQQRKKHTGWARFDYGLFGGGRYEVKWIEHPEMQTK